MAKVCSGPQSVFPDLEGANRRGMARKRCVFRYQLGYTVVSKSSFHVNIL